MSQLLSFLRHYALRYWPWYLAGGLCLFGTNYLAVQIPLQMAHGIDALRAADLSGLQGAAARIAAMGVGVIAVRTLSRAFIFTPGRLVEYHLRGDLFAHLLRLPRSFYDRNPVGDLVSRASNDITFVRVLAGFGALQFLNVSSALFLTGREMLKLSPALTAAMLAPISLAVAAVQLGTRRLFALVRENQQDLSALSEHILASLQGVQTLQGFNAAPAFTARFAERSRRYMQNRLKLARIQALILPLLGLAGAVALYLLLSVGGPYAIEGRLSPGQLAAFTGLLTYLLMPLRGLGWLISVYQRGLASLGRVEELLREDASRPGGRAPREGRPGPAVEARDLCFSYPESPDTPALSGISFTAAAGTTVGVFGRTGAGKTTLLRLLARIYDPPAGALLIDGEDLLSLSLPAWRAQMAVVPQVPFLFSETIADNISMGAPDPARLSESLSAASLSRDLERLPQGVETVVGERGVLLSGGQRQRVALARALYRRAPRLLLLDDVLSAVDHRTEQEIISALERLTQEGEARPTALIISHRMSVLARCDQVLVLEAGRLVDVGTHEALISRPGPYREAWERGAPDSTLESA